MQRDLCKSKIHRATITEANLDYEGSVTIDRRLLEAADIVPYEKVQVVNLNNGSRFESYALPGEPGSGALCLNGAAARLGAVGDRVIVISYARYDEEQAAGHEPRIVFVDERNRIVRQDLAAS